jgi:hypothetical protein
MPHTLVANGLAVTHSAVPLLFFFPCSLSPSLPPSLPPSFSLSLPFPFSPSVPLSLSLSLPASLPPSLPLLSFCLSACLSLSLAFALSRALALALALSLARALFLSQFFSWWCACSRILLLPVEQDLRPQSKRMQVCYIYYVCLHYILQTRTRDRVEICICIQNLRECAFLFFKK